MTYTPVEVPGFNGLDLRLEAQLTGPGRAVDALNVMFDREGQVRTRYGLTSFVTLPAVATAAYAWPGAKSPGDMLVAATAASIRVYNSSGTLQGSTAIATSVYTDFAAFGTPSSTVAYLGESSSLVKLTTAGVQTSVASAPVPVKALCVQTPDNRLVVAGSTSSRVSFSGAGVPETFGTNDWVDLEPGDRDTVVALVSWNNQVFAFKNRKFYVFYGNSVDGSGNSVFNYRRVAGNAGVAATTSAGLKGAVAADDGVYFIADDGVYKTTGGPAVKISDALDPLFQDQTTTPYFNGVSVVGFSPRTICYSQGNLYLQVDPSGAYFVYDIRRQTWTYWEVLNANYPVFMDYNDGASIARRMVSASFSTTGVSVMTPSATSDNGTAIVSRYRSGFWNPGQSGAESVIREWLIDGSGTINFTANVNDGSAGTAASVTLGTSPAVAQGRDRRAVRGRNVSFQIGASSGAWSVSRVTANIRGQRNAGLKAT